MPDKIFLPDSLRILFPEGNVAEMKLETYLASVVGTEMSPSAPVEALKVQAVASRTYAASAHRHPEVNADVCTTAHCQRWRRIDPTVAPEVFRAVSETWGIVAAHDNKLIDAYYFEHCDGKTRNAEDVLTTSLAYLRSVECPCGFVGMRGHGLGLCQRGVIVMARRGASFEQILRHYYRGVAVVRAAHVEIARPEIKPAKEKSDAPGAKKIKRAPQAKIARTETESVANQIAQTPKVESTPALPEVVKPATMPAAPAPSLDDSTTALLKELEKLKEITAATMREATTDSSIRPMPRARPQDESEESESEKNSRQQPHANNFDQAMIVPRAEMTDEKPAPPPLTETETPSQVARRVVIDHLPGERLIAGNLPRADIAIVVEDVDENKTIVFSGNAPQYGAGGFETPVEADGRYFVTIAKFSFEVSVNGDTVFIHAQNLEIAK